MTTKKHPRAKAPRREHTTRGIPDNLLRFSFRFWESTRKFGHGRNADASSYLHQLLQRFQTLSSLQVKEFRSSKGKALRAHRHEWARTTQTEGFSGLATEWEGYEAWQFQVTANQHGRVHGILIDEVFYVIWLDPDHRLYA